MSYVGQFPPPCPLAEEDEAGGMIATEQEGAMREE
jgi:hypothetical protein